MAAPLNKATLLNSATSFGGYLGEQGEVVMYAQVEGVGQGGVGVRVPLISPTQCDH